MNINEGKERNALAELAHTLCGVFVDNRCYATVGDFVNAMNAIKKSRRIIEELAKVKFGDDGMHENDFDADVVLSNCRAIAEEEGEKE